ncbi:type IX secretion system anionic LPS delivery protein PorZ [Taibaiella koreensis]|uniref:type IX secretion system anionic LPS delivery protein PorZ n=1 Tax=Taibaiella koreensis TaxID=1268548 RepID=UPI000E599A18|nr:two-component regulator propeller domain-containing protein [Taibaiella koreensis]
MSKLNFIPAILFSALAALCGATEAHAQKGGPGVAQWKSLLPYNQVNGVATDGTTFFCATTSGFFTYNRADGALSPYSKVNGMHDVGLNGVAYDATTGCAVLAYSSSNIDIFKDNTFSFLPDFKSAPITGDKTIHSVTADNGIAYLSTGIGLVRLNLQKKEIKETITFYDNSLTASVYATITDNTYIYSATSVGLFRIAKNSPSILDQSSWKLLDPNTGFRYLAASEGNIYAAQNDSLFRIPDEGTAQFLEKLRNPVSHLDAGLGGLWVSTAQADGEGGYAVLRRADGSRIDSFATIIPAQVVHLANGEVWFGDASGHAFPDKHGLRKKIDATHSEPYFPDGPIVASSFDVWAYDDDVWVAHGGKRPSYGPTLNRAMMSEYRDDSWMNISWVPGGDWVQDFIRILKDRSTNTVYAASLTGGLYERDVNGNAKVYGVGFLDPAPGSTLCYVTGLALDADGNLWMNNFGSAKNELVVKTRDGRWINGKSISENTAHSAADVIVDQNNLKWFITLGAGAIVYDDKGTLDNTSDDAYRIFRVGEHTGNLPDNNTLSIAEDKDGAIWIGTANGIAIVNCGAEALDQVNCQAELRVIQNDQFAGYLFEGESVRTIAVDGANRKWIGTSNGVWLVSDDGSKTIYRFTEQNSPLPANGIERININPVTGDVFISTEKGLVIFRGTATEGTAKNADKLYIYPNPVPTDYNGMVAVRGVAENADVRFTDVSGQLVYRTRALGGQAVWNCKDYTGRKVQSGVYLVFVVNKDGTQKATGKFMIHQ